MGKYFGTDGIRGVANKGLDCQLAFKVGQAAALVLTEEVRHKATIYIGKDTRVSSDMLEAALVAGVTSAGSDVVLLGTIPTPAVAFLTKSRADAGIVISASHNPFEYNGIKLFNTLGFKLSDELENRIEELMDTEMETKTGAAIGRVIHDTEAWRQYVDSLLKVSTENLSGIRVVADCSNGAASETAKLLFSKLGLKYYSIINSEPDGVNINENCGSTNMDSLRDHVVSGKYDIGIAFDGDADRCLAVDEKGRLIDGDCIMAAAALSERKEGFLPFNTMVATVMSNFGLHKWAKSNSVRVICAPVGDRNVLEEMLKGGFYIGGEQSGHVIFHRHSTTGDGQLTAVKLLNILASRACKASKLLDDVPTYPQVLINVPLTHSNKDDVLKNEAVLDEISKAEKALKGNGRVLVRPSGTENLVRVMIEGQIYDEIKRHAEAIASKIM